jgi:hypothetical protein
MRLKSAPQGDFAADMRDQTLIGTDETFHRQYPPNIELSCAAESAPHITDD